MMRDKFTILFFVSMTLFIPNFSAADAEKTTLLAFGDSLTQGYGLARADGFVPQLENWLKTRGENVVIVNAGVSGDTSAGGAARIAWSFTPEIDAVIVALGGNDLLRALPPEETKRNLDFILSTIAASQRPVLLIGHIAPLNYGAYYAQSYNALFETLSEEYDTLWVQSFLRGIFKSTPTGTTLDRQFLQKDGIHPNAEGVRRIVSDLGPDIRALIAKTRLHQ